MMRISTVIACAFGSAVLVAACAPPKGLSCGYGMKLAHPTMAAEDISVGIDGRVRAVSEGATGAAGAPR